MGEPMAYWWVNHKQTRNHEVRGGYLWSPLRNANGAFNRTYENMRHAKVGDIVFSFANAEISAFGRVTEEAVLAPKPSEFGSIGSYWSTEGWLVGLDFREVPRTIRPKDHITGLRPMLPAVNSPIQANGNGNQGCYLAAISDALGHTLMALTRADELPVPMLGTRVASEPSPEVLEDIHAIEADPNLTETQRLQLTKARIGQGLFRKRVLLLDGACRVTGVDDPRLLIASHIKAWKDADNGERISGFNGLLLSPHVDALFDQHLLTFGNEGSMHVHPSLKPDVLEKWSIDAAKRVGSFRPEQLAFLDHHRLRFHQKLGL
jgi:putative restriction endonuclease